MSAHAIRAKLVFKGACGLAALRALSIEASESVLARGEASLTDGLEALTCQQIQERFAAHGIEMTADFAAQVQLDAVEERKQRTTAVIVKPDHEHPGAPVDGDDGSASHRSSLRRTGGSAC